MKRLKRLKTELLSLNNTGATTFVVLFIYGVKTMTFEQSETYLKRLPAEKQLAVELLAIPSQNNRDIADRCGVSVRTLYRWQAEDKDFKKALEAKRFEYLAEILPTVIGVNVEKAKSGDIRHIELIYKLVGLLVKKKQVEDNGGIMTNEDIRQHLQRISEELKQEKD